MRRAISQELRKLLAGETPARAKVLSLGRRYGELDGQMSRCYALAFAKVNANLTGEKHQQLKKLRNLENYPSKGAFIYSQVIPISEIPNTDFLFGLTGK